MGASNGLPLGRAQLMGGRPRERVWEGAPSLWVHGLGRGVACQSG